MKRSPLGNKSSHSPMCCPGGEGGRGGWGWGIGAGRVGWGEVGENGECGLPLGEKGCDCSRSPNYCHTLSMRNIERERL